MNIVDKLSKFVNDYSIEKKEYNNKTKDVMNNDPIYSLSIPLSECIYNVSIIIPTWNSGDSIIYMLETIGYSRIASEFNSKLEIIVVDDGSTDDTYNKISSVNYPFDIKYIRQKHISRSAAINTGARISSGDILIFCDSDILFFPNTLDEIVKRQQLFLHSSIFFGFREDCQKEEINFFDIKNFLIDKDFGYEKDNRFNYDYPHGWAKNMMRTTAMLNGRKGNQNFYVSNGDSAMDNCWQLYRMVYGFLFSVSKKRFVEVGGFDERLKGWGWEDSLFAGKCMSIGMKIIPVTSAHCIHMYHEDRSKTKWEEAKINYKHMMNIMSDGLFHDNLKFDLLDRVVYEKKLLKACETEKSSYTPVCANPIKYNFELGNYEYIRDLCLKNIVDIDEQMVYETAIYLKDFSIIKSISKKHDFVACLAYLLSGESENNLIYISNQNDYSLYIENISIESFFMRAKQYEYEKQYLLAIFDFFAIACKQYLKNDIWDCELICKIKYLYEKYEYICV